MGNDQDIRDVRAMATNNAVSIGENGVKIEEMGRRFDKFEQNQQTTQEIVGKIQAKIFDGYDESIKKTESRTQQILDAVNDHRTTPHMSTDEVRDIVTAAISAYDSKLIRENGAVAKDNRRWMAKHKLEILAAVTAICAVAATVFGILF